MCDLCGADVPAGNLALHAMRCPGYLTEANGEPYQPVDVDATTGSPIASVGDLCVPQSGSPTNACASTPLRVASDASSSSAASSSTATNMSPERLAVAGSLATGVADLHCQTSAMSPESGSQAVPTSVDATSSAGRAAPEILEDTRVTDASSWACPHCTYENHGLASEESTCEVCFLERGEILDIVEENETDPRSLASFGGAMGGLCNAMVGVVRRCRAFANDTAGLQDTQQRHETHRHNFHFDGPDDMELLGLREPFRPTRNVLAQRMRTSQSRAAFAGALLDDTDAMPGEMNQNGSILNVLLARLALQHRLETMQTNLAMEMSQEDDIQQRMVPASRGSILALPTHTLSAAEISVLPDDRRSCMVCMEEFKEDEEQRTLPCFHSFHTGCVDRWLQAKGECPICRVRVDG